MVLIKNHKFFSIVFNQDIDNFKQFEKLLIDYCSMIYIDHVTLSYYFLFKNCFHFALDIFILPCLFQYNLDAKINKKNVIKEEQNKNN